MPIQYFVPRKCRTRVENPADDVLADIKYFRHLDAYVLLGDPGAGKSRLFKDEAQKTEKGIYITARDFIDLDRDEWHGKVLFIDGLDEVRAGRDNPQTPLGAIRSKLDKLGRPSFRLSCRAADWHGNSDIDALEACSPGGKVTALYLEPLDDKQVQEILEHDDRVIHVEDFLENASRFDMDGLLDNPQTLDMLIEAVEGHSWPTTKLQVYELACNKLGVEHRDNSTPSFTLPQLLDAAGWLCALQLLSNATDIHRGSAHNGGIGLSDLECDHVQACQAVLGTRLFTSVGNDTYTYVHRSIAEFLGARYISGRLKRGLPFNRVLAIATGFDGGIVAALRGLMAWLGAHHAEACNRLIEVDSLGMVLYGDAQLFPIETKRHLLDTLEQKASKIGYISPYWNPHGFAALATQEMVPHLIALLSRPSRAWSEQNILICLLEGLRYTKVEGMQTALTAAVRDSTYLEGTRVSALQALIHQYPDDGESLLALAEELRLNKITDYSHRLLEILLSHLFPRYISPDKVLQYSQLHVDSENTITRYDSFWDHDLPEQLSDQDVPGMLDALSEIIAPRRSGYKGWHLRHLAKDLLIRGIHSQGEHISAERLYRWLSIGMDEFEHSHLDSADQKQIADWLTAHQMRYLELLQVGVHNVQSSPNIRNRIYGAFQRLYDAKPPTSLGAWWLEQALITSEKALRDECFSRAFWLLLHEGKDYPDLSLERFEAFVDQYPEFREVYDEIRACDLSKEEWRREEAIQERVLADKYAAEEEARINYFRQYQVVIASGSAHSETYHYLAAAWFDPYTSADGNNGEARLADLLGHDEDLINAAKSGILKVFERQDLPSVDEIFDLALKDRQHYIRIPFLLCMAKFYEKDPTILCTLEDTQVERALAFWYTYGIDNEPDWVKHLMRLRPTLTVKVYVDYVRIMLAAKKQHITGIYALARDPDFAVIAPTLAMQLLETYPVRSAKGQVDVLRYLLQAAIVYADKQALLAWIQKRLTLKGLDVAQRIYLMATGFILAPTEYSSLVRTQVATNITRINHLSTFLCSNRTSRNTYSFPAESMGLLIEILGPRCSPEQKVGVTLITQTDNERDYVRALLNKLEGLPDATSSQVLDHLLTLPPLAAWHEAIRQARQAQQLSRREAIFKHPDIHQVFDVLSNRKATNVADLAALTGDFLHTLSIEMHTSDTDSYKQFWNVDGYNKPISPRPENSCRDYLARQLKELFKPFDVAVQSETREADSKRADIRIAYRGNHSAFHLPIEIKLDHSPDLWRAIHEQLIPLYTISPETGGRGMLLIIWFNDPVKRVVSPPTGTAPKTASELTTKLQATLSPDENKLIDVFVLDVSRHS